MYRAHMSWVSLASESRFKGAEAHARQAIGRFCGRVCMCTDEFSVECDRRLLRLCQLTSRNTNLHLGVAVLCIYDRNAAIFVTDGQPNTIRAPAHSYRRTLEGQGPDALEAWELSVRMKLAVLGQTRDQVLSRTPYRLIYCVYDSLVTGQ